MPTKTEQQLVADIAKISASRLPQSIDWLLEVCNCESPIERVMLVGIYSYLRFATPVPVVYWSNGLSVAEDTQGPDHIMIHTQAPVEGYRIDILIVSTFYSDEGAPPVKIAVERDGHEFHERTKEQAGRDKARDRRLQKIGYRVFRHTGSEIWSDPYLCAHDVCTSLLSLIKNGKQGG